VLVAFGIAMVETAWPILPGQPVLGTSWLGPWIVAVGVIVPNRPIWTLLTVALKHVQAVPVPPSQRTELPIPRPLEALILDCLEKNPAARPASARGISSRLAACGVDAWTCDDADRWWERHLPSSSALRAAAAAPEHTPGIVRKT
jgi:hypothetical protein